MSVNFAYSLCQLSAAGSYSPNQVLANCWFQVFLVTVFVFIYFLRSLRLVISSFVELKLSDTSNNFIRPCKVSTHTYCTNDQKNKGNFNNFAFSAKFKMFLHSFRIQSFDTLTLLP